jgi:hypothetical protein
MYGKLALKKIAKENTVLKNCKMKVCNIKTNTETSVSCKHVIFHLGSSFT